MTGRCMMGNSVPSDRGLRRAESEPALTWSHAVPGDHKSTDTFPESVTGREVVEQAEQQLRSHADAPVRNGDKCDSHHPTDEAGTGTAASGVIGTQNAFGSSENESDSCMSAAVAKIAINRCIAPSDHSAEGDGTRWQVGSFDPLSLDVTGDHHQSTDVGIAALTASSCHCPTPTEQHIRQSEEAESSDHCQRWQADKDAIPSSNRRSQRARKLPEPLTASQKPTKRRPHENGEKPYQKRNKTQGSSEAKELALFKEMDDADQDIIQPRDIYQRLLHQCSSTTEDVALFLVRLFYAIASPQALSQRMRAHLLGQKTTSLYRKWLTLLRRQSTHSMH
jgi:hypothetical protein